MPDFSEHSRSMAPDPSTSPPAGGPRPAAPGAGLRLEPIGLIRTPFREPAGAPIQARAARGALGTVEVDARYAEGLDDLDGFERIWLVYWFHRAAPARLRVVPYLDERQRGVFATRSPARPNPIGLTPVRLLSVSGTVLKVADVDMLDGSPLLDIKPYVPAFDCFEVTRTGWVGPALAERDFGRARADRRFLGEGTGAGPGVPPGQGVSGGPGGSTAEGAGGAVRR